MLLESIMYEIETMGTVSPHVGNDTRAWRKLLSPEERAMPAQGQAHVIARLSPCHLVGPSAQRSRRGGGGSRCCPRNPPPDFPGAQDSACSG